MVQHTFAYITAAKSGISEIELEDVLSLDDRWDLGIEKGEVFPGRWLPCTRANYQR